MIAVRDITSSVMKSEFGGIIEVFREDLDVLIRANSMSEIPVKQL